MMMMMRMGKMRSHSRLEERIEEGYVGVYR